MDEKRKTTLLIDIYYHLSNSYYPSLVAQQVQKPTTNGAIYDTSDGILKGRLCSRLDSFDHI